MRSFAEWNPKATKTQERTEAVHAGLTGAILLTYVAQLQTQNQLPGAVTIVPRDKMSQ